MSPRSRSQFNVLVVDDDSSVLECYKRLLDRSGYATATENDPLQLLRPEADLSGVDLLVLDYKMPGMDGLTLLAELRRREIRARCILISAFLNDGVRQQAAILGVDRILEKPVDVAALRGALSELLPVTAGRRASAAR